MSVPTYTEKLPTEPGLYFYQFKVMPNVSPCEVLDVLMTRTGPRVLIDGTLIHCSSMNGWWAGPLIEPPKPIEEKQG